MARTSTTLRFALLITLACGFLDAYTYLGNLMRVVESGYAALVDRDTRSRSAIRVYAAIVAAFAGGAVIGGFATHAWSVRASWVPAGLLAVTLVLFIVDERSIRTEFK